MARKFYVKKGQIVQQPNPHCVYRGSVLNKIKRKDRPQIKIELWCHVSLKNQAGILTDIFKADLEITVTDSRPASNPAYAHAVPRYSTVPEIIRWLRTERIQSAFPHMVGIDYGYYGQNGIIGQLERCMRQLAEQFAKKVSKRKGIDERKIQRLLKSLAKTKK